MKAIAVAVVASVGVATVVGLKKQVKDEMEEQNQLVEENEYLRKEIEFLTREISISQDQCERLSLLLGVVIMRHE